MVFNGAVADAEVAGDLFAGLVISDKTKYTLLGVGEVAQAGHLFGKRARPRAAVDKITGNGRAYVMLTFYGGLDAAHDFNDGAIFEHEALSPAVQRLVKDVFVFVHGEENDFDR